ADAVRPAASDAGGGAPAAARTIDRDRDLSGRVVTADGAPVDGALVEIRTTDDTAYRLSAEPGSTTLGSTRTDGNGEFAIRLPQDSAVDVRIVAASFGIELLPDRRAGERIDVQLAAAARLQGRVVRGAAATPVGAAELRFVRRWPSHGSAREVYRGTTASDGSFAIPDLCAGRGAIEVRACGAAGPPVVVTLTAGAVAELEVHLDDCTRIVGTVVDAESGQPIDNAEVRGSEARPAAGDRGFEPHAEAVGRSWTALGAVRTDAAGHFEVDVPSDFRLASVHVRADGHAAATLPAAITGELRCALERGWSASGRALDSRGAPIVGATVVAAGTVTTSGVEHGDWVATTTASDGCFELRGLRSDVRHRIALRHPDRAPAVLVPERPADADHLELGDLVLPAPATLRGVATDPAGTPVGGAYLAATDALGLQRRCRTDDLGRFAFTGLPPGTTAITSGDFRVEVAIAVGATVPDVRVELPDTGVFGVVTDVQGSPILHAMVLLGAPDGTAPRQFVTAADGRFEFPNVPPGSYSIVAAPHSIHLPGGDRMVHQVRIREVQPSPVELRVVMPPAAPTCGVVLGPDGEPRSKTMVFARDDDGKLVTYDYTDADGTFVLRLQPGTTVHLAVGTEDPHRIVQRDVVAGTRDVQIRLGAGAASCPKRSR
ncbi:MAG: carboxypeptidase regulatory-like domain-containing protein, partial [Planctomycetes bacterium]|nr:carboxypeptidase regulatory-like domain-containing protein [Planctomycetota bacterium]